MHDVYLGAQAEPFGKNEVAASTYAVESGPIKLESRGRELVRDYRCEWIGRVWDSTLTKRA